MEPRTIIGLDIGGTKCAVVRGTADGKLLEVRRFPTTTCEATVNRLLDTAAEMQPGRDPLFGISCGSPQDSHAGLILAPPNLPGWDRVPIVKLLTDRFGGEAHLMNDANTGALAEWQFGAGRGYRNVIFLTHGTGMGAGLILDGRLYEGTTCDAGEVGHMRLAPDGPVGYGKAGSFEGFCSGGGIARLAQARARSLGGKVAFSPGSIEDITAKEVVRAAEKGDSEALAILDESGRYLGMGLAILIDVLNPEVIVLGSLYTRAGRFFDRAMNEVLDRETLPFTRKACRIVPSALGEETGCYAAIAVAVYRSRRG